MEYSIKNIKLTGKYFYKKNWYGKEILMVEKRGQHMDPFDFYIGSRV